MQRTVKPLYRRTWFIVCVVIGVLVIVGYAPQVYTWATNLGIGSPSASDAGQVTCGVPEFTGLAECDFQVTSATTVTVSWYSIPSSLSHDACNYGDFWLTATDGSAPDIAVASWPDGDNPPSVSVSGTATAQLSAGQWVLEDNGLCGWGATITSPSSTALVQRS